MPTLWSTAEQQDTPNLYRFDTLMRGANLDSRRVGEQKWLCYYFFYELVPDADQVSSTPFKIDYARISQVFTRDDESDSGVKCTISDALEFYTRTYYLQTVGVTDLHSFFVDSSIAMQSSYQRDARRDQGVFVLAHLLEIADEYQTEAEVPLYHPSDSITVSGYFMDNSGQPSNVHLRLRKQGSTTPAGVAYSQPCAQVTPTQVTCRLGSDLTVFGYLEVSLVEKVGESWFDLSDAVNLLVVVLPKPSLSVSQAKSYVSALTTAGQAQYKDADFTTDITFSPDLFTIFGDDVEDLAYLFTD